MLCYILLLYSVIFYYILYVIGDNSCENLWVFCLFLSCFCMFVFCVYFCMFACTSFECLVLFISPSNLPPRSATITYLEAMLAHEMRDARDFE